ncbi:hypothetical protein [Roseimaritima ulvae]|uniref:Replication protein n=1 Tax=Roseimaritima ulvae TaxID=980254 RepID=A0A5B9R4G7_9BACT|nr:hypothetical protein [Roseimaritima ulvae]QEG41341.1 hypothetical protein UC8_33600 [Roseimaritima ulvae]
MSKPVRTRPSLIQARKVRVGDYFTNLDTFHDSCNERNLNLLGGCRETLRLEVSTRNAKRRILGALTCGRLLKPINGHSGQYERAQYCRIAKLCPVCRASLAHKRTLNRFDVNKPNTDSQVLASVFHYHFVDSYDESISFCRHAIKQLLPAILRTCREYTANARLSGAVLDVVGAMHIQTPPGRERMQPHVHAVLTLDKDVDAARLARELEKLTHLAEAQDATRACQSVLASCKHHYYSRLRLDSTCLFTGRSGASRNEITFAHLRSLQEYVQRFASKDDLPGADLQRKQMMRDAGLSTHLACSRCQAKTAEAPCSYVSTTHYLVLPFTGEPFEISADARREAETQLRNEAHRLLLDALDGELTM